MCAISETVLPVYNNMDFAYLSGFRQNEFQTLSDCHTLPDSANRFVKDSKILCPFVSIRMRFLSVPLAVYVFRVR